VTTLRIDKDLCTLCGHCVQECPLAALVEREGEIAVTDACTLCGICGEICPVGAISVQVQRQPQSARAEHRGIWIIAEENEGRLHGVTFELIGAARQLAEKHRGPVEVLVLGQRLSDVQGQLAGYPVERAHVVEAAEFAQRLPEPCAEIAARLIRTHKPEVVLAGATSFGRSLMPRIAVLLETGLTADCTGLDIDPATGDLLQTRPAFGGDVMATITCSQHRPQMATVRPRVMPVLPRQQNRPPHLEFHKPDREAMGTACELIALVAGTDETINIADVDTLVAGGAGLGGPEGFDLLRELAGELGGVVAASRAAVDAGWIPYAHQVGQTGRTVQPRLYVACGISGSIQHRVGMQSSGFIAAINTDPDAPIFQIADRGIVGDYRDVVPELINSVRELRKQREPSGRRATQQQNGP